MFEKFKLPKDAKWLLLACIGVGALIAFPIVAQFFAAKLLEPVASLWGSALGAWAAIAGAFWVADRQASQQRRSAAALVHAMFHPLVFHLDELAFFYGAPTSPHPRENDEEPDLLDPEQWASVRLSASLVKAEYEKLKQRMHRVEAVLHLLGPDEMRSVFDLESELAEQIPQVVARLHARASETGLAFYPGPASCSQRFVLAVFLNHVRKPMSQLLAASR